MLLRNHWRDVLRVICCAFIAAVSTVYGALGSAAIMPFYLHSMESGTTLLQFTLSVLVFSCAYAAAKAVWPSFYAEMFSARVRFSGLAIGTRLVS